MSDLQLRCSQRTKLSCCNNENLLDIQTNHVQEFSHQIAKSTTQHHVSFASGHSLLALNN